MNKTMANKIAKAIERHFSTKVTENEWGMEFVLELSSPCNEEELDKIVGAHTSEYLVENNSLVILYK